MTVRAALATAASDLYRQSWRLLVLNALLGAALVAIGAASVATPSAFALGLLAGPLAAAVMHCAVTLAQTDELRLLELTTGLRRHWRRGFVLAALVLGTALLGAVAVDFYTGAGVWAWPLAALSLYLMLAFAVFQLALWPLAVYERERRFREVAREAARIVVRRPLGFAGLAAVILLVNAVGLLAALIPFLTLTIAYSFLAVAHFALPKNPAREA